MKHNGFTQQIFLAFTFQLYICLSISSPQPFKENVVGAYGGNASLKWLIPSSNEHAISFILKKPPHEKIIEGDMNIQHVTQKGFEIYGSRISAVHINQSYVVTLTSLTYNDTGYYRLTVALKNYFTTAIHLKVNEPFQPIEPTKPTDPSINTSRTKKYIIISVLLVVLTIAIVIVFVVIWVKRNHRLSCFGSNERHTDEELPTLGSNERHTDEELPTLEDKETA